MNLFSCFPWAMAHLFMVLFIKLAWHVIWLPNEMEVNNKWSHCKIIMCKMDEVECLVSKFPALLVPWVIHHNFSQCILYHQYAAHFQFLQNAPVCQVQTDIYTLMFSKETTTDKIHFQPQYSSFKVVLCQNALW